MFRLLRLVNRRIATRTPCENGQWEENNGDKNSNPGDLHDALLMGGSARCVDAEGDQRERSVVEREITNRVSQAPCSNWAIASEIGSPYEILFATFSVATDDRNAQFLGNSCERHCKVRPVYY